MLLLCTEHPSFPFLPSAARPAVCRSGKGRVASGRWSGCCAGHLTSWCLDSDASFPFTLSCTLQEVWRHTAVQVLCWSPRCTHCDRCAVRAQLHCTRIPWASLWGCLFVADPIPNRFSLTPNRLRNGSKHVNGSNVFFSRRCTKFVCGNGGCSGWKLRNSSRNVVVFLSQCDNALCVNEFLRLQAAVPSPFGNQRLQKNI